MPDIKELSTEQIESELDGTAAIHKNLNTHPATSFLFEPLPEIRVEEEATESVN